jgi:hypothetical protein
MAPQAATEEKEAVENMASDVIGRTRQLLRAYRANEVPVVARGGRTPVRTSPWHRPGCHRARLEPRRLPHPDRPGPER